MNQVIRQIPSATNQIYLTFDDGPVVVDTKRVMDILDDFNAKATFFCIADMAKTHRKIVDEILERGHAVGNHSLDHKYSNFFSNKDKIKVWIEKAQSVFVDDLKIEPVGFRSPAGILTPPLTQALQELNLPLIHWNRRFFDTSVPIGWMDQFNTYKAGDIVLLHDRQRPWLRQNFIKNLPRLIEKLAHKGFDFHALSKENFLHGR